MGWSVDGDPQQRCEALRRRRPGKSRQDCSRSRSDARPSVLARPYRAPARRDLSEEHNGRVTRVEDGRIHRLAPNVSCGTAGQAGHRVGDRVSRDAHRHPVHPRAAAGRLL